MIPASIQVACYFYESEMRQQWEHYLNCDSCGSKFDFLGFIVVLLRPFMSIFVGLASAAWICCDKTIQTWRKCFRCESTDKDSTMSTTSTLTTHDTCLLPNPHGLNTYDRHNCSEFQYEYYNHGNTNKLLL